MTNHATIRLVDQARRCLLDPEQTAVEPTLAEPLRTLLDNVPSETGGAREVAIALLDHEHTRITAPPAPDPIAAAKAEALRAAAAEITGTDAIPLGRRQTKEWLLGLADHAEGKR